MIDEEEEQQQQQKKKKQKKISSSSCPYLPQELVVENILTRLSVRDAQLGSLVSVSTGTILLLMTRDLLGLI